MRSAWLLLLAGCTTSSPAPERSNSLGMRFLLVPAGEFLMGSTPDEAARMLEKSKNAEWYKDSPPSESPPRRTRISRPFYVAVHETTLGAFRAFVSSTSYVTDAERDGKGADGKVDGKWSTRSEFNWNHMGYPRADDQPVVNVSWNDAVAYCTWLSRTEGRRYRLPTEAEWEYFCRAGTPTRYFWGDDEGRRNDHAWTGANAGGAPKPVGTRAPNAWGLHDTLGNVYEYCSDWHSKLPYDPKQDVDPTGPATGMEKVVRSTSWGTNPIHTRCAFRGGAGPDHRNMRDGFRVVCETD